MDVNGTFFIQGCLRIFQRKIGRWRENVREKELDNITQANLFAYLYTKQSKSTSMQKYCDVVIMLQCAITYNYFSFP